MAWQYNIVVQEKLNTNQLDSVALVNRPSQGQLVDRLILSDAINVFPAGNFIDQMVLLDSINFALAGGTAAERLYFTDRMIQQDKFSNPNILFTQLVREGVVKPTDANIRLTQAARELLIAPTDANLRLTQIVRELVMQFPEAFPVISDYQMLIEETLSLQESLLLFRPGNYFLLIGEHITPGLADRDTNQNVKVKGNQNVKASNFATADTTLNHWQDKIFMTPFGAALAFTDSMNTQADALASKLPVTLNELLADQDTTLTDAQPSLLMSMGQPFIQTLNQWQEFIIGQPLVQISAVFAEVMQDQDQESLGGFAAFFVPLSDTMVFSDVVYLPIQEALVDTLTLTDNAALLQELDEKFVDALVLSDALAFNNPQAYQDQLTMSDSFTIAEELDESFSDSLNNWADAFAEILASTSFSDQMVFSDSFGLGYGNAIPDTTVMVDGDQLLFGIGMQVIEQLVFSEGSGFGYGFLISDQLVLSDTIQLPVWLVLADALGLSDSVGAGYGSGVHDQNSLADAMSLIESFEVLLAEATPGMLEAAQFLFNYGLVVQDFQVFLDQLQIMYGLSISGEALAQSERVDQQFIGLLLQMVQDDGELNWLDALIAELVFAPSEIVIREFKLLNRMLADAIDVAQQQSADKFKTQGEQQVTFEVLLDGEV